ncbi:MAG: tRNA 2-thiouridine(34) synthase MnmA [Bacteroides sp.]
MARVVVGLSGGVDSSVAAYLLKQAGHDVVGVYMRNWTERVGLLKSDCPFEEDTDFAAMVARKLRIPFEIVDLSEEYKKSVIEYLFAEYEKGRTPNPDVLCNREIKFAAFWNIARARGADFVATGHYCRKEEVVLENKKAYSLLSGVDSNKDQSYFLCQVNQEQLSHALFPIGGMLKTEVRDLAKELGLATAQRKDSYGICFVGKIDLPTFLGQRLKGKPGEIVEIPRTMIPIQGVTLEERSKPYILAPYMGKVVGTHAGAQFYTIGQRKGLGVGGKELPLFVLSTDINNNIVYVGQGHDHPYLRRTVVKMASEEVHWVNPYHPFVQKNSVQLEARLRYRQPLQKAELIRGEGCYYLVFHEPQRGVTPGQFAAWYAGDELLGSAPVLW